MSKPLELTVRFKDCILEEEIRDVLPHHLMGCFVFYDGNFHDALMIQEGAHMIKPDSLKLSLDDSPKDEDPKLVFIVKHLQKDEPYVGSVSIARSILHEGMLNYTYEMWITLFDD